MPRLTKTDIEKRLLAGLALPWEDGNGKRHQLLLGDWKARNILSFLMKSSVRNPTGLPEEFLQGLADVYESHSEPTPEIAYKESSITPASIYRLNAIETEGFGGLNVWKGPKFRFEFERESLLLEGPNGSGKSSLAGAIVWALAGERPHDYGDIAHVQPQPVFRADDKQLAGNWPPIATYPPSVGELSTVPRVRVKLEFKDESGNMACVERTLDSGVTMYKCDPQFQVPSVFIETGFLMPARMATLRLSSGPNRLTDAVQMLTGMDDFAAIGGLVEGLCHKGREFLSFKKKELATARADFAAGIDRARADLESLGIPVPSFTPDQTSDKNSPLSLFGKAISEKAEELGRVIENDLASGLQISTAEGQTKILAAVELAKEDVSKGLSSLPAWACIESLETELDPDRIETVTKAIGAARASAVESVRLLNESQRDPKFQLKALAAQWHNAYKVGMIVNCPLCEQSLAEDTALSEELERLRMAGSAAVREFDDNVNAILSALDSSLSIKTRQFVSNPILWEPRAELIKELYSKLVSNGKYSEILVRFTEIVSSALENSPRSELPSAEAVSDPLIDKVNQRITRIERAIELARWFRAEGPLWRAWWNKTVGVLETARAAGSVEGSDATSDSWTEGLSSHLSRLSGAIYATKPYRSASDSLRRAWLAGKAVLEIEKELVRRRAIAELIEPLKELTPLSHSLAREAIDQLSGRMSEVLGRILITEHLQFRDAQLQKKEGVVVYGGFGQTLRFDATLIANTSWLRAVLWAFIFALREEAVEQHTNDSLPILLFDDPQATFDAQHRHRWALYVASLQQGLSPIQLILTSHDETFLELIKTEGIKGRQALCAAAGPERGFIGIFEGDSLTRKWQDARRLNSPQAGRDYMSAVRVYLEGVLQLVLRGEAPDVSRFVIGDSREKLMHLNSSGRAPWDRPEFRKLESALGKQIPQVKHIEMAHHASGQSLGMAEATDVEQYWRKRLAPSLDAAYKLLREHRILHGGLSALRAAAPLVSLPEGYGAKISQLPLSVLGRAAALSHGRAADGCFDMTLDAVATNDKVRLSRHSAYRLSASTLEPVARPGDILLVTDAVEPSLKSLVVAVFQDRVLARRFDIADNHSDIAVLTAQATNPRSIVTPVIAQRSSLSLHKVVGVLYEKRTQTLSRDSNTEVCECAGEAQLREVISEVLGLVEVAGQSAEPYALDGQYLLVENEVSALDGLLRLDGRPVIAADTSNIRYFKRLRLGSDRIVLESLDSSGNHPPVMLEMPGTAANSLERVWPVAGVLFELPR